MHRTLVLLATLAILSLLASCGRSFELFPLVADAVADAGAGAIAVALRERPGRSTEEEGFLIPGETTVLELEDPVAVGNLPTELVVRFDGFPVGVSVAVRDESDRILARFAVDESLGVTSGSGPISVAAVLLPGTVSRLEFAVDAPATDVPATDVSAGEAQGEAGRGVRLAGLVVRPMRRGVGVERSSGEFGTRGAFMHVGPGAVAESWSDRAGSWGADFRSAVGWDASSPIDIRYAYEPAGASADTTGVEPATAVLEVGGSLFELELRPGANRVVFYPEVERVRADRIHVRADSEPARSGLSVEWIGMAEEQKPLPAAVPVDFGTLQRYDPSHWRESQYELFSWTLYPRVLVIDSASYAVQARFFKRLAFFVEKVGYRGTVLTDAELHGRHGYNAHNYNAAGLADFFNAARREGVPLNAEEELLRDIVLAHGIIRTGGEGYLPNDGGVLAVAQESSTFPGLRELLVSHEAYHGVYYAEPDYVRAVDEAWESLDARQQRFWTLLLSGLRYDVDDEYLVRNEYHAYLLQQPVTAAGWYFESRSAERLRRWYPGSADWFDAYFRDYAGSHREQAAGIEADLFRLTGLRARDVFCLERISGAR